jgi:dTDP-4-amino-4,6-dideoxygalactose transaminase
MKVPFVDLYAQYISIKEEIDLAISQTIRDSSYIGGRAIVDFENAFANYLGNEFVIACGNGTDSLEIIMKAWGIGEGDEVIVPAHSWISTSESVGNVGATPVFVDIEPDYYTLNPALLEDAITPKTKAIIPVHLFGHPADMPAIMKIAEKYNLKVLEDCAQSHGASINGKKTGTFGHASSFSFYPGKNLGAYGDAGCMSTSDGDLAEKLRMIANHGQKGKHNHLIEGRNSRLDGLQAAVLLAKLPHLEKWTALRRTNASIYSSILNGKVSAIPKEKQGFSHVYHLYVVRLNNREEIMTKLKDNSIETAIHYPTPLPLLKCYESHKYSFNNIPVASSSSKSILSLPLYPELTDEQIKFVTGIIAG